MFKIVITDYILFISTTCTSQSQFMLEVVNAFMFLLFFFKLILYDCMYHVMITHVISTYFNIHVKISRMTAFIFVSS